MHFLTLLSLPTILLLQVRTYKIEFCNFLQVYFSRNFFYKIHIINGRPMPESNRATSVQIQVTTVSDVATTVGTAIVSALNAVDKITSIPGMITGNILPSVQLIVGGVFQ